MNNIINTKEIYYQEGSNTGLIWIIGIFILLISFAWNTDIGNNITLKSNINENRLVQKVESLNLTIGKQTIFIDWKEYILEITPKF